MISRRGFNRCLAAGLAAGSLPGLSRGVQAPGETPRKLRVAAIQMRPRPGDVAANLEQAEQLIRQAQRQGAGRGGGRIATPPTGSPAGRTGA